MPIGQDLRSTESHPGYSLCNDVEYEQVPYTSLLSPLLSLILLSGLNGRLGAQGYLSPLRFFVALLRESSSGEAVRRQDEGRRSSRSYAPFLQWNSIRRRTTGSARATRRQCLRGCPRRRQAPVLRSALRRKYSQVKQWKSAW